MLQAWLMLKFTNSNLKTEQVITDARRKASLEHGNRASVSHIVSQQMSSHLKKIIQFLPGRVNE